jgi:hypothetical protein
MPVKDICRGSLRLVASSGIVVSVSAPAALKSTTLQRDLACEAIFPWLVFAVSTIAAAAVFTDLGLRLFAGSTDRREKRSMDC